MLIQSALLPQGRVLGTAAACASMRLRRNVSVNLLLLRLTRVPGTRMRQHQTPARKVLRSLSVSDSSITSDGYG